MPDDDFGNSRNVGIAFEYKLIFGKIVDTFFTHYIELLCILQIHELRVLHCFTIFNHGESGDTVKVKKKLLTY